jgi:hypothetical protein
MASLKAAKTVGELIECLQQFEPADFVLVQQVFALEAAPILGVAPMKQAEHTVVVLFDE